MLHLQDAPFLLQPIFLQLRVPLRMQLQKTESQVHLAALSHLRLQLRSSEQVPSRSILGRLLMRLQVQTNCLPAQLRPGQQDVSMQAQMLAPDCLQVAQSVGLRPLQVCLPQNSRL